jgi:hypothetical protein
MSQAIERLNDMMNHQTAFRAFLGSTCRRLPEWLSMATLLAGCAAALPQQPTERALYIDARKALHGESRLGWTVDRVELAEAAAQTEPSACRVPPQHRKALRDWLGQRIAALGGPAEQQYRAGRDIGDLDEVIDLERTRALLDDVELHLPADCPFWVKASEDFSGLHSAAHGVFVIAESMGAGSLSLVDGRIQAGGGGAARLFAGYGISTHWQLAVGIEAGGDAILQKESGSDTLAPEGAFRFGVPAFLRLTDIDRIYDVELAAVARLQDKEFKPWGARVGLAGGVAGLRRLGFMPSLQLWLGYEVFPAQDGLKTEHVMRLGTRVGIDWHP